MYPGRRRPSVSPSTQGRAGPRDFKPSSPLSRQSDQQVLSGTKAETVISPGSEACPQYSSPGPLAPAVAWPSGEGPRGIGGHVEIPRPSPPHLDGPCLGTQDLLTGTGRACTLPGATLQQDTHLPEARGRGPGWAGRLPSAAAAAAAAAAPGPPRVGRGPRPP